MLSPYPEQKVVQAVNIGEHPSGKECYSQKDAVDKVKGRSLVVGHCELPPVVTNRLRL